MLRGNGGWDTINQAAYILFPYIGLKPPPFRRADFILTLAADRIVALLEGERWTTGTAVTRYLRSNTTLCG